MSKHTQGQWVAEMYPSGGFEIGVDGAGFAGGYFVVASRQSHPRIEEMHANARLIASAPDLLEALIKASVALRIGHNSIVALEKAAAAIAKATGEQA